MKVHGSVFMLVQLILFLGGLALIGGLVFYFSGDEINDAASYAEREAQVLRLRGSAQVHYRRFGTFDSVCAEIGVPDGIVCSANETHFALEALVRDGSYYCADNMGFEGVRNYRIGSATSCE